MKRRLMLAAMSLILTVTLSVTSMNTVAEASPKMSPTEENLEITINSFLESDGAVAEELTDEMLKTFLETPLDFLRVIDTYPLDKQELLLSRIANVAVGMPDEERLSFEDIIYSADETTPGISLLETYYSEALEATPPQNSVSNLPKYDMESVNQIVKAYLASDSEGNEAFYNYLSNVYSAEPELMESVMMNYSDSEIQTLAKDLAALYREDSDLLERFQCDGRLSAAVLEAIDSSIEETSAMTNIAPYAVYTPKITSFSYTKKIEVGTPVPLSIKLTETSGTSSARTYTVKVFCTRSGKEWQVATTTMTIPAGSTVATKNVNITFSHAGTFTTRVAVYNGSALLVTRSGANPDVSYGNWKITVTFDPDRLKYGSFSLYNAAGEQQVYGSALGRGENNLPENQQHGNTPCGTYSGILAGPHKNTDSFGPNKYIQTHAIDAHTAIILIHLDKLDLADRRIVELQGLCIAWVDRHRLRAVGLVELVARSTFDFGHHDGTDNTADADLSMFVCHITAIARDRTARGIDIAAVSVRNLKLRPRHSLLRRGAAVFLDDQISERLIHQPTRCRKNAKNNSSSSLSLPSFSRYGANFLRSKLIFFGGAVRRWASSARACRHTA